MTPEGCHQTRPQSQTRASSESPTGAQMPPGSATPPADTTSGQGRFWQGTKRRGARLGAAEGVSYNNCLSTHERRKGRRKPNRCQPLQRRSGPLSLRPSCSLLAPQSIYGHHFHSQPKHRTSPVAGGTPSTVRQRRTSPPMPRLGLVHGRRGLSAPLLIVCSST